MIRTADPLALLYNDASPMENHHVAAAFLLMSEDQYAFLPRAAGNQPMQKVGGHAETVHPAMQPDLATRPYAIRP